MANLAYLLLNAASTNSTPLGFGDPMAIDLASQVAVSILFATAPICLVLVKEGWSFFASNSSKEWL